MLPASLSACIHSSLLTWFHAISLNCALLYFHCQYFCLHRGEEVQLLQGEKPECCSGHTEGLCVRFSHCTQDFWNNVFLNVLDVLHFSGSTPKHAETQTSIVKKDLIVIFSVSSAAQTAQMHLWKTYKRSWMQESNIIAKRWLSKSSVCVCVCLWSPHHDSVLTVCLTGCYSSLCRSQIHECSSDPQKPCGSCWWRRPDETQQ